MNEPIKAGVTGMLVQFSDAQKLRPRPQTLGDQVRAACNDKKLWSEMWPYLTASAGTDSREFDHAICVDRLLAWDKEHGEVLIKAKLSHRKLWNVLKRQIGHVFDMDNGHIAGLLEADNNSNKEATA